MEVEIINLGETIVSWTAPDKKREIRRFTLGLNDPKVYLGPARYLGAAYWEIW
ncbi:MAG: hypothetical protein IPH28_08170 [Cytophagaceae bacterium]|nr:hypothetical protein [Cytophagaceae bacterium]